MFAGYIRHNASRIYFDQNDGLRLLSSVYSKTKFSGRFALLKRRQR